MPPQSIRTDPAAVKSSDTNEISFSRVLTAGTVYVLEGLSSPVSAAGEYSMTLDVSKSGPAADVQISLSEETVNYPAQFAEQYIDFHL